MDELYDHAAPWVSHGPGSLFSDWPRVRRHVRSGHERFLRDALAPPVVRAVWERMAAGNQFPLPSEDALVVAEDWRVANDGQMAVHVVGNAGEHRGSAGGAGSYRPREDRRL